MATKEQKQKINSILKTAEDAVKEATKGMSGAADPADKRTQALLTQLKMEHQEATLKIKRRQPGGSYALFVTLEGLNLEEVAKYGLDHICEQEGGDGTYTVDVFAGGRYQLTLGPFNVATGIRHDKARSLREAMGPGNGNNPFGAPMGALGAGGAVQTGPSSVSIKSLTDYMNQSQSKSQEQNDRLLGMMQMSANQQMAMMQQQQQQQTQMLMALFGSQQQQQQNQPNQEVQALQQQIAQMQQQQQHEQAMRALEAKIDGISKKDDGKRDDLLMTYLLKSMESSKGEASQQATLMATMMQAMQQASSSSQENMWKAMSMIMDKPPEDERLRGMMDTMSTGMMNLFSTMGQIATSGLLGGGGNSTVQTLVEKAADIVTELGVVAMQRGGDNEIPESAAAQQIQAPQMPGAPEPHQLPEHPSAIPGEPEPAAPMGELDERPVELDDRVFDLASDPGLAKIIDLIETEGDPREISARLWAHRQTGHKVSNEWWESPTEYGYNILRQLQISYERAEAVTKDIIAMREHVDNGGNPNAWSADVGYLPQKIRRSAAPSPVAENLGEPEMPDLVSAPPEEPQEIDETTIYNPNKPPEGSPPEDFSGEEKNSSPEEPQQSHIVS